MAALASPLITGDASRPGPSLHHEHQRSSSFTAVNGAYNGSPGVHSIVLGDTITVQSDKPDSYEQDRDRSRPTPPPSRQENPHMEFRSDLYAHQQLPSPTDTTTNGTKRKRSVSLEHQSPPPRSSQRDLSIPQQDPNLVMSREAYEEQQYRQQAIQRLRDGPLGDDPEQRVNGRSSIGNIEPQASTIDAGPYEHESPSQSNSSPNDSDRPGHDYSQHAGGKMWPNNAYPVYPGDNHQHRSEPSRPENGQRDVSGQDQSQSAWVFGPANSDGGDGENSGYADSIHAQLGPKRKRNFSNRTKTGCMTCRKRKKKCDEGHPSCQNCHRGGFKCEGYSGRTAWPKPANPKTPVPLQAKDGYSDNQESGYIHDIHSPHAVLSQLPPMTQNGSVPRPLPQDANDPSTGRYMTSPASATPNSQPTYSAGGTWPVNIPAGAPSSVPLNPHPAYPSERHAKPDYRDLPPLHNPNRHEVVKDYAGVPPISEISRAPPSAVHASSSGMNWPGQSPADHRTSYPPPSATPASATMDQKPPARMAIESQPSSAHPPMGEEAEKDKMIRGRLFKFMDRLLSDERDHCRAALWRLNNAGNPAFGISERERTRLLKQVLTPPRDFSNASPIPRINPSGSLGPNAFVELPFKCHYGYNIKIGEDAYIGENCTIIDACQVSIGAKTWIGANVTILTAMAHTDLQYRQGTNSSWQGRAVIIEEDVYIGAGVMIYPGVTLQRGAFIEPGSIVKTDQQQYGYLGYKPVYLSQ